MEKWIIKEYEHSYNVLCPYCGCGFYICKGDGNECGTYHVQNGRYCPECGEPVISETEDEHPH